MYPAREIEKKWQSFWQEIELFKTPKNPKRKFYLLEMFPYPSGDLHMGHLRNYVMGDVVWRYLRMRGYDLLHPFGWDAFGLPAEEAAIKRGESPKKWTMNNISVSKNTLKLMGLSYDWDREVTTCNPDYYRWTQWLFLKLYEHGLAYRKEAYVNWCPGCQTVLANEQVIGGKCWRCDSPVRKKALTQWFIKITEYAERLLKDIDKLEGWPERVKTLQRNWIGKSEGAEIDFEVEGMDLKLSVFTTRPDTLFGVTFITIAPEHPVVEKLIRGTKNEKKIREYIEQALLLTEIERTRMDREKTGIRTGRYAIHPFTGERIEIWIGDYVLVSYGTGIVMGVPAHDQRDFEFAKKHGIPIKVVIRPPDRDLNPEIMEEAYEEEGIMINSGIFSGLPSREGIKEITKYMEAKGIGRKKVTYRLRDWLVSRQRYWGAPIPMIHCERCGIVPVPYEDLPVLLPPEEKVDFTPRGKPPLASVPEFINTTCPKCGGPAKRDPDTMDTFVDSAWYHIRYLDPKNEKEPVRRSEANKWFPIDLYIGGIEHATGHLIYFRFITKFLYDLGYLPADEPALRLFNQGMITDEKGIPMSKSMGNAVPVGPFVEEWGADTARATILFLAPPEKDARWSEKGVTGVNRFLTKAYNLFNETGFKKGEIEPEKFSEEEKRLWRLVNRTIKNVSKDMESFGFNTAIAFLMEMLNELVKYEKKNTPVFYHACRNFVLLLSPFAPHLAEELWEKLGEENSIFNHSWPSWDERWIEEEMVEIVIQVNGKVRDRMEVPKGTPKEELEKLTLERERVKKWIEGKEVVKVVAVPDKIVNVVVK